MTTRQTILLMALCTTATACAKEPPQSLEQQLSGKNAEERREILTSACEQESNWPRTTHTATASGKDTHTNAFVDPLAIDMQALCDKLDVFMDPDTVEKLDGVTLAQKCRDLARRKHRSHSADNDEHAAKTLRICEEALGTRISPMQ